MLQQIDSQHRRQWIRWPAAFLAGLGIVVLEQVDQRMPRHHHLHLSQKFLQFGQLFSRGKLVIREVKLLVARYPCPGLRTQSHCSAGGAGIPEAH